MIPGLDVSTWEPVINWAEVLNGGYQFAFIKCSQADFNDPKFYEHWRNARIAGMPRGAYHFYDVSKPPEKQAEKFFSSLEDDLGELPFVLDIEGATSGPYYGSENWYRYITRLNYLSNNFPLMIYTGYYYWIDNVTKQPAVQDVSYFGKYPLWIANYRSLSPMVPYPWKEGNWLFWQYSESGKIQGVYDTLGRLTECDLDYFNGTQEQFQLLLDSISSGGNTVSTFYLAKGNATIRTGPGSSYAQVSSGEPYVLTNDIVESLVPQQNGWANIANIYRNNVQMTVANPAWCTAAYLQPTSYSPPSGTPPVPSGEDDLKIYKNDVLIYHIKGTEQPL